jgi:hypothetical protein
MADPLHVSVVALCKAIARQVTDKAVVVGRGHEEGVALRVTYPRVASDVKRRNLSLKIQQMLMKSKLKQLDGSVMYEVDAEFCLRIFTGASCY